MDFSVLFIAAGLVVIVLGFFLGESNRKHDERTLKGLLILHASFWLACLVWLLGMLAAKLNHRQILDYGLILSIVLLMYLIVELIVFLVGKYGIRGTISQIRKAIGNVRSGW